MTRGRFFAVLSVSSALVVTFVAGTQYPTTRVSAQGVTEKSVADQAWDDLAIKGLVAETESTEAYIATMKKESRKGTRQLIFDLVESYRLNTQNPETLKGVLAKSLNTYTLAKLGVRSAPQATQVAAEAQVELAVIQISQNQRIIALLDVIAKKK